MTFAVASYNVLADAYINPAWYPATDPALLDPARRHPALVDRISRLAADVICLQEVEHDVFRLIEARLASAGYDGKYAGKGGGKPDGCATFLKVRKVPTRSLATIRYTDGSGTQMDSGHVALVVVVEQDGRQVGLANTHVKWDPPGTLPAKQVGLRQIRELLNARALLAPGCSSWIVCGDLNVTASSPVVQALQAAGFVDAYAERAALKTCVANGKSRRIDYLFHTADLQARPLDLPFIDDQTPLPSAQEPSDHLPIVAEFAWKA